MRRFITTLCFLLGIGLTLARAGTYSLSDGNSLSGEPISFDQNGVVIKSGDDSFSPRTSYDKFTQDGLRQLLADAKKPSDKAYLEGLIEEAPQEKAKRKAITIKPVSSPERPEKGSTFAVFKSPLGWVIILILYGATIFAGYEVALFRNQPFALVCGLAAIPFFGFLSPILFLSMPTRTVSQEDMQAQAAAAEAAQNEALPVAEVVPAEAVQQDVPKRPSLPQPMVFKRGDFTFHRRFFETKLAGFLRLVPSQAEKDMIVHIKAMRGEYIGRRVIKIEAESLTFQVFKEGATADEVIPFSEIQEVQIRHKDWV